MAFTVLEFREWKSARTGGVAKVGLGRGGWGGEGEYCKTAST